MKPGTKLLFGFLLAASGVSAQLSDSFSDGDFSAAPAWTGTSSTFIVSPAHDLQTSNTAAATSYLAAPHGLSSLNGKEWRIKVRLVFSPSSSNYSRVFLTSTTDLSVPGDGFFLQFGESGSMDAIRLKKTVAGVETEICSGPVGQIANSFTANVKVTRNSQGLWSVYTDMTGGTNYELGASGNDTTQIDGDYFGMIATYTASNATKFHFDDIYAGPEVIDSQAPLLLLAGFTSSTSLQLEFSEPVSGDAIAAASNYSLSPENTVISAIHDAASPAFVQLQLANPLINGQQYSVNVNTAEDAAGNDTLNLTANFTYLVNDSAAAGDVIISEFLCNPVPSAGLPELEFVELYNRSEKYFDLTGWKIGDHSSDGTITGGWIAPGEYKIICATSSQPSFPGSNNATSFPGLNNAADDIVLKSPSLAIIDKISYTDEWYRDELRAEGGYSIELINPHDPCSDASNWAASTSSVGGTPGLQNSIYDTTPDTQPPFLTGAFAVSETIAVFSFSEGMDSVSLVNAQFHASPELTVSSVIAASRFTDSVFIEFATPFTPSENYQFTYGEVADCWLNIAGISGNFTLAETAAPGDIVINEILFDPGAGGCDFIELYNRSQKVVNLKGFALANYDDGVPANHKTVSSNQLLFPGDYIVLTPSPAFVAAQFPHAVAEKLFAMPLPAYHNDSSTVILFLPDSSVCDLVSYHEGWQLSLIDDTENKALERIDPNGVSNNSSNWHTAAESVGFGTPGRKNSQYQAGGSSGSFGTMEPIFSPDNDGFQDVMMFCYTMPAGEMIATVNVYDDQGQLIRKLQKNELLGTTGNFTWDGINDDGLKAQPGIYLCVIEAFSIDRTANFSKRIAFTLAEKL